MRKGEVRACVCVWGGGRKQRLGCKTSCSVFHSGLCVAWVGHSVRFISRIKKCFRESNLLSSFTSSFLVCLQVDGINVDEST